MKQRMMRMLLLAVLLVVVGGFAGLAPAAAENGRININTATVDELVQLKGIGPAYAKRVVAYREANGDFRQKDELTEVEGIGPKTLSDNRDQITVGTPPAD